MCFYHAGCPDGFGAAWAAWQCWGDRGDYRAIGHHDIISGEAYRGAEIVFVDIVPNHESLRALAPLAKEVWVLDHHQSALERWRGDETTQHAVLSLGHHVLFDLDRSGAALAWDHFHPERARPKLIAYIQDQDLWRFELSRSHEINAAINSYPRQFDVWQRLEAGGIDALAEQGRPLVRAEHTEVQRALHGAHRIQLGEWAIEATNATVYRSRVGHELARRASYGRPFGMVYRVRHRRVDISLYSIGDLDVSTIAARYGGGGHRNAAGFQVTLKGWVEEFVLED